MNVALLLITHQGIASSLLEVTSSIINDSPSNLDSIEVPMDLPPEIIEQKILNKLDQLETTDGVLMLTDMYGSTPCNIANKFNNNMNIKLVSGLNLPMLVKTMNYRNLTLDELVDKALSGGKDSISLHEVTVN